MPNGEHPDDATKAVAATDLLPVGRNGVETKPNRRRSKRLWRWAKRALLAFFALLVATAVGLWFARDWLGEKALALVDGELSKHGIYLRWESANYRPIRGLVLEGVALCETAAKKNALISIENIGIHLGLRRLLREHSANALGAKVTTEGAEIALYHEGAPVLVIDEFSLAARATASAISVARATGSYGDLDFSGAGTYRFPPPAIAKPESKKGTPSEKLEIDFSNLSEIKKWLEFSKGGAARPKLDVEFDITSARDVSKSTGTVGGRFDGESFTYQGLALDKAAFAFKHDLTAQRPELPQFAITYRGGNLSGSDVAIDIPESRVSFAALESSIDLIALIKDLDPKSAETLPVVTYQQPPAFSAAGSVLWKDAAASTVEFQFKEIGRVTVPIVGLAPLEMQSLAGSVTLKDRKLTTSDLAVRLFSGSVNVSGTADPFRASGFRFDGQLKASELSTANLIQFAGASPPAEMAGTLSADFDGTLAADLKSTAGSGQVGFGTEAIQITGPFQIQNGVITSEKLAASLNGEGALLVAGKTDIAAQPLSYQLSARARSVPMPELLRLLGSDAAVTGLLHFSCDVSGTTDLGTLSGAAAVKLTDGRLYSVPVIGPVQKLLTKISPIFGRERKENLSATFTIKTGVATTPDLLVASDGTLVHVNGDIDLGRQLVDVIAYATLDGGVGLATGIVTRLVEIRGTGPISDPKLSLNKNPTDLAFHAFDGAVDLAKFGVTQIGGRALGAAIGIAKNGAESAVKIGEKGVSAAVGVGKKGAEAAANGVRKVGEEVGNAGKGLIRKLVPGEKKDPAKEPKAGG